MSADIERSGGTPALDRGDRGDELLKASIARALTPDVRDRQEWDENMGYRPATVEGDILDTAPRDCTYWSWWWSQRNGEIGFSRRACGRRECSACAPGYLADRVAPAVKVWGSRALRAEYATQGAWKWEREHSGLSMRGERAESGLLVIRHGDPVVVWMPVHVGLDGAVVLSGKRLRGQLVDDLRAVPLPMPEYKPKRNDNGDRPIGAAHDLEYIEWNAQQAGIDLKTGKRRYGKAAADDEQGRRFVELMRTR
jgi:hypothetical protein